MEAKKRKIVLAAVWGCLALILVGGFSVSAIKKKSDEKKSSASESASQAEAQSIQESINTSIQESREEEEKSSMEVRYISMGQSDAIVVNCDGHYMLIDSGDLNVQLSSKLLALDISEVDILAASTTLDESVGGFARAMSYFSVGQAFCAETESDNSKFSDFSEALNKQNVVLNIPENGQKLALGKAEVTFYRAESDSNHPASLVIMIEHKDHKFLFAGKAGRRQLEGLMQSGIDLNCDVLKVGDHGADFSLSAEFLTAVTPEKAVISSGEGYGCPSHQSLYFLSNQGVTAYRTDMQGDIQIISDKDGIRAEAEHDLDADTLANSYDPANAPVEPDVPAAVPEGPEDAPVPEDTVPEAPPAEEIPVETPPVEVVPEAPVDVPAAVPTEATPNELGFTYGRIKDDPFFHLTTCPLIQGLSSAQVEFYSVTRDEIVNQWRILTPCPTCNP